MIELVVVDMAASLAFYRRLGLDIPADADEAPHVEVALPGGLRLTWDTEDTIRSFIPDWKAGNGASHPTGRRVGLTCTVCRAGVHAGL